MMGACKHWYCFVPAMVALLMAASCRNDRSFGTYDIERPEDRLALNRLTETARPLIDDLHTFRLNGGAYPRDIGDIEAEGVEWEYVPPYVIVADQEGRETIPRWYYTQGGSNTFSLYGKIGVDAYLEYQFIEGKGQWLYDPGTGEPSSVLSDK